MKLIIVIPLCYVLLGSLIVSVYCSKGKRPSNDNESQRCKHWDDEDKKELLKIFYETNTSERNHARRIKEKWDCLHSAKRACSSHSLYTRSVDWIKNGEADRLLNEEERLHRNYKPRLKKTKWTPEMVEDVLRFHNETNSMKSRAQSKRMKELWDKKHPNHTNIKGNRLMLKVQDLKKGKKLNNTKKMFPTNEERQDLLRCYYMASNCKGERLKVMQELFIKRHPRLANFSYNELRCYLFRFRKRYPEIDRRLSEEFSASNTQHPSWLLSAESDLKREESANIAKFRENDLLGDSNQYPGPDQNIPWKHHMFGEPSSSGQHTFSDVSTSQQFLRSGPSGNNSGRDSAQYYTDQRQRKSSRGEEPELDLDLHLR